MRCDNTDRHSTTAKDLTLEEIDLLWVENKEEVINSHIATLESKGDHKDDLKSEV